MSITSSSSGLASDTEPPFAADGPWSEPGPAFGGSYGGAGSRTPPQDNDAEQSVLGSMLLSKD
ncbi:MAG: replicative DNA helicase, partial [Nocardioidaceae bacterium]